MRTPSRLLRLLADPRRAWTAAVKEITGRSAVAFSRICRAQCAGVVVMFHVGRSGSTVLADLLNQHPRVYWDGEVYERRLTSWEQRGQSPLSVVAGGDPLQLVRSHIVRAGRKHYGVEIKPFHLRILDLQLEEFVTGVAALAPLKAIVLERKNYLRKIVSSVVAHQNGKFHTGASAKSSLHRIHLNVSDVSIDRGRKPLIDLLLEYEDFFDQLTGLLARIPSIWITYEQDLAPDPRRSYERVCSFLNLPPHPRVKVRYGRTNPYPLRELIANFREVEVVLRNTRFAWMLND